MADAAAGPRRRVNHARIVGKEPATFRIGALFRSERREPSSAFRFVGAGLKVQEMLPVREKRRESRLEARLGIEDRCAPTARCFYLRQGPGIVAEKDDPVAVPCAVTGPGQIAQGLGGASGRGNRLQLAVGEKADGLTVGGPERSACVIRPGELPPLRRIESTDVKTD
jgi:hypothetical protein